MVCQACGHVCQCPNCSVALTYHRDAGQFACHIGIESAPRGYVRPAKTRASVIPAWEHKKSDTVKRLFPKARVARMDADAMSRKTRCNKQAFKEGAIDILVGTR